MPLEQVLNYTSQGGALTNIGGKFQCNGVDCKIARGQRTTAAASETIVTGLSMVYAAFATIEDDVDAVTLALATCQIGDQAGAPAAGSIILKTWKVTATGNATLIATTSWSKKVNWIAIGY
jgi:hypothetical protein